MAAEPSWPERFRPQDQMVPSLLRATVWPPPPATTTQGARTVSAVLPLMVPTVATMVSTPTALPVTSPSEKTWVSVLPLADQAMPVVIGADLPSE